MSMKWSNVVAFGLLVFAFVAFMVYAGNLAWMCDSVRSISSRNGDPNDRAVGLCIVGVGLAFVVAALRVFTRKESEK